MHKSLLDYSYERITKMKAKECTEIWKKKDRNYLGVIVLGAKQVLWHRNGRWKEMVGHHDQSSQGHQEVDIDC